MAVAFDAVSEKLDDAPAGSSSWSHTCSGAQRCLLVFLSIHTNTFSCQATAVTYNGVSLTSLNTGHVEFAVRTELWRLTGPASGANTIAVTWDNGTDDVHRISHGISYTGVDQTTPNRTVQSGTGTDGAPTLTYTNSQAGDTVVAHMGDDNGWYDVSSGTQRAKNQVGDFPNVYGSIAEKTNGTSVTISWSKVWGSDYWRIISVGLVPGAAAGSPPPRRSRAMRHMLVR